MGNESNCPPRQFQPGEFHTTYNQLNTLLITEIRGLSDWKMGSLRLETVFVAGVLDLVGLTVLSYVSEAALDGDGFGVGSNIFELAGFLGGFSIAGFHSFLKSTIRILRFTLTLLQLRGLK